MNTTKSDEFYQNQFEKFKKWHLNSETSQRKWRQKNSETLNAKATEYYYKLKEDPVKWRQYLDKANQRYHQKKLKKFLEKDTLLIIEVNINEEPSIECY